MRQVVKAIMWHAGHENMYVGQRMSSTHLRINVLEICLAVRRLDSPVLFFIRFCAGIGRYALTLNLVK